MVRGFLSHEDLLYKAHITVLTDHRPLTGMLKAAPKAESRRIQRWALALSSFDFEVQYIPGASHYLANYFSRAIDSSADKDDQECELEVGCELSFHFPQICPPCLIFRICRALF